MTVVPRSAGLNKTFAALRHRNFRLFAAGQLISVAGTWMQAIAQGWLVYQLTHSDFALGQVAFASAIPALLITPWGGVLVDRVPKRSLLVATQASAMLLAFTLAALTFAGVVQVWHIIALAAGLGVVNAFDAPARQAFVVEMVSREDLTNAIALNSMVFNSGRVVGPAVAGLVLAAVGSAWCFFINGVSFIAVIIGLLAMRIPPETAPRRAASPLSQLASGLRYTLAHRDILSLILLALVFSLFGISYSAVLPAFVQEILHAGAGGFGAVNAATGLGAVTGAFIMASYPVRRRSVWLRLSNLLFSVALLLFAANGRFLLSLPLAFGLGVGFMLEFTLINTLLQTRVSDDMRGRVLSLYTLTFFGISPFGNLVMGALAERWGLSLTIGISAILTGALSLLIFLAIPHIRKVD